MNYNKVMIGGNLTRDVEIRTLSTGTVVGNVGIAMNRKWTKPDGTTGEEVTFVDCEAWGRTAEVMAKYLVKGRPVFIEGRLKLDQWQDKQSGQQRSKLKVLVGMFQFVDSRNSVGNQSNDGDTGASQPPPQTRESQSSFGNIDEDDVPF